MHLSCFSPSMLRQCAVGSPFCVCVTISHRNLVKYTPIPADTMLWWFGKAKVMFAVVNWMAASKYRCVIFVHLIFFFLCLAVLICGYFDVQLWFQGFTPLNHCISQLYCKNQDWYFFWYFTHRHLIFFVINQTECGFDIPISFLSFFWIWKTTCMFAHGKWTCQSWCSPFIFFFKCGVKVVHIAWNILDRPSLFFSLSDFQFCESLLKGSAIKLNEIKLFVKV